MSEQRQDGWKRIPFVPIEGETWLAISDWPRYQISDLGRIRFSDGSRLVNQFLNSKGYLRVVLRGDGARKEFRVHVLVLRAFCGPRPEGLEGRHLDGNKTNNAILNLKYGTHKENEHDKVLHGTVSLGNAHGRSKLTIEQARAIKASGHRSNKELRVFAKDFGVTLWCVRDVVLGRAWAHA